MVNGAWPPDTKVFFSFFSEAELNSNYFSPASYKMREKIDFLQRDSGIYEIFRVAGKPFSEGAGLRRTSS